METETDFEKEGEERWRDQIDTPAGMNKISAEENRKESMRLKRFQKAG